MRNSRILLETMIAAMIGTLFSAYIGGCQDPLKIKNNAEPSRAIPTMGITLKGETLYWEDYGDVFSEPHLWTWKSTSDISDRDNSSTGRVRMTWDALDKNQGRVRKILWAFSPVPPVCTTIEMTPKDGTKWHSFRFEFRDEKSYPVPILKMGVESPLYGNLLDLVQTLTSDHFNQIITKWPPGPIPLRIGHEQHGDVDLSACLRRAMSIWNQGTKNPWFVLDEDATWGIRLLHYRDPRLSPPLRVQLTRHDAKGNPIRMNIVVGDNYSTFQDTTYVIRGMVHELAHTLLLWGHSSDRNHSLWGAAPPLVKAPSPDERKAAQLVHGLPEGVDLKNYVALSASE